MKLNKRSDFPLPVDDIACHRFVNGSSLGNDMGHDMVHHWAVLGSRQVRSVGLRSGILRVR
jgi:hypothetical protein